MLRQMGRDEEEVRRQLKEAASPVWSQIHIRLMTWKPFYSQMAAF